MTNKVTMKMVENDVKKYDEIVEIDFEDTDLNGVTKTYTIELTPFFSPMRINNVLESLQKDLADMSKKDSIEFPDELLPLFITYHAVLEFTNLPKSRSKDIERRIAYFYQFVKSKYFKLVDEYLIQEEVNKVIDKVFEIMKEHEKLQRMAKKVQSDLLNLDLKSPELREQIQGKMKRIPEA